MPRSSKYFPLIIFMILSCTKDGYNPKLSEYLKTERELRSRIGEQQGVRDSIRLLQKKHGIDADKELSKLKDNPEDWIKLFEEINIEK